MSEPGNVLIQPMQVGFSTEKVGPKIEEGITLR
jgi:hypothetical protein